MLDILISQTLYISKELFITVNTISRVVKITPQFLGQFCLAQEQFIQYTYPLAVSVIIVIICRVARISHKFSSFIRRGIIHSVCFLLLLSYTSVATTSLLLLRSVNLILWIRFTLTYHLIKIGLGMRILCQNNFCSKKNQE